MAGLGVNELMGIKVTMYMYMYTSHKIQVDVETVCFSNTIGTYYIIHVQTAAKQKDNGRSACI